MQLIGRYHNAGFESVADGVMDFFERRKDLQRPGVAFGPGGSDAEPAKVSTDISLVALSRSDPESLGHNTSDSGTATGRLATKPPSRCTACWPGSSTAIPWRKRARNSTGRSIMRWRNGASC